MLAEVAIWPIAVALPVGIAIGVVAVLMLLRRSARVDTSTEAAELDAVRARQQQTLDELRKRIEAVQASRQQAETERSRLLKAMEEISGSASSGVTVAIANVKHATDHVRKLEVHEGEVAAHDEELEHLQQELGAAEELLRDVDTQRNALEGQLKDRDRELWRLRSEIESVQRRSHEQRARTMMLTRSSVRKTDVVANRMEDQLKRWVKKTGEANVNFSEHGHASMVAEFFEKLDREFIDRFFSHATNPEYERGQHRAIHIHEGKDPDGEPYGELRVALDDDAGRTLGLRFELRGGAPDAKSVGFVLAMYLRAINRDLRDFEIVVH
jgi:DNA repair exonuclease SbcCD ATPase subunit